MEEEVCGNCEMEVKEDDEFCTRCGNLFDDAVSCYNHEHETAEGVCVICNYALCNECGMFVNDVFLCSEHEHYEIYQSLAVITVCKSSYESESLRNTLIEAGLHPFLFTGTNTTYTPSSESNNQNVLEEAIYGSGETKILVPLAEVLEVEKILRTDDYSSVS